MAAMMAREPMHQSMLNHPGRAVGALEAMAAVAAEGQRREAATVEEQERLLPALEICFELIHELRRQPPPTRWGVLGKINGTNVR